MCGIVGFVGQGKDPERLASSVDAIEHRGPDSQGSRYFPEPDIFLGHTRLAILDLSPAGAQPMATDDGKLWITYNGEIYNFVELRESLERKGTKFQSRTDTEVLLHLYRDRGPDFVKELNGIFALALYDEEKQELLLARDHMGVKPLYYTRHGGKLAFASEIKSILAADAAPREVDWQAVYDYFTYLYVPWPRTAFAAIEQLPPAHTLRYDLRTRQCRIDRYWDPRASSGSGGMLSAEESSSEMRRLLEDSVQRQLISDVPVGVFLSGGIDSATLTALAMRSSSSPVRTFTVAFGGQGILPCDEREAAARISKHLGTEHTEVVVNIDEPDEVFDLVRYFDQPFGNSTLYLSYLVSKVTREHVTVVLSGAGGDELFGGYPRYRALGTSPLLSAVPALLGRPIRELASRVPEDPDRALIGRVKRLLRGIGHPLPEQYMRWTYYLDEEEKQRLLVDRVKSGAAPSTRILEALLDGQGSDDLLSRVQYADYNTFLVNNILEYTDKTSMASGLEARVPFLDPRLVELSLRIPSAAKIQGSRNKAILRDAYPELLPRDILEAPKRGFCPPLPAWMKDHFDRYFDERLTPSYVRDQGVFEHAEIQRMRGEHAAGKRDNSNELFGILMFDRWFSQYIAGA